MKVNNPAKIGLMVMAAAVILVVMTVRAGNFNPHKNGYRIKVVFNDIDGVNKNSPVMFNGFEVGVVDMIDIVYGDRTKMELTIFVNSQVRLKTGAKAYIKNLGFMGEKYVALTGGDPQGTPLLPGAVIDGQEPTDFMMLMSNGNDFLTKLNQIAANVNERLAVNKQNIDGIITNTNVTLGNFTKISENLKSALSGDELHSILGDFSDMASHLNSSSVNLEELSQDLKLNPWKLLRKNKEKEAVK